MIFVFIQFLFEFRFGAHFSCVRYERAQFNNMFTDSTAKHIYGASVFNGLLFTIVYILLVPFCYCCCYLFRWCCFIFLLSLYSSHSHSCSQYSVFISLAAFVRIVIAIGLRHVNAMRHSFDYTCERMYDIRFGFELICVRGLCLGRNHGQYCVLFDCLAPHMSTKCAQLLNSYAE